jgi:AAA15 family ATPase/GTPase
MLNSFYIRNFRLFREFSIENLGQVNLIAGKNNSGKSCLLEALYLYAQNASPIALHEIMRSHQETWEINQESRNHQFGETESPFRHLFYGYHLPKIGTDSIEIGHLHEVKKRLKLQIAAYQTVETKAGRIASRVDTTQLTNEELDIFELVIECEENDRFRRLFYLNREIRKQIQPFLKNERDIAKYNVQYVPSGQFENQEASNLWDKINIHPHLRQEVFKGLRLIDDGIQEIVKIGDSHDTSFILIYRESDERLPLLSQGDGMAHLFHIVLALVNAKGGLLLIDEFENGLHYEVHPKLWKLIFQLAEQLNVQVFATTHSQDTVQALKQVACSLQQNNNTKFIKLKPLPKAGVIKSVEFDFESLSSVLEQGIEVR